MFSSKALLEPCCSTAGACTLLRISAAVSAWFLTLMRRQRTRQYKFPIWNGFYTILHQFASISPCSAIRWYCRTLGPELLRQELVETFRKTSGCVASAPVSLQRLPTPDHPSHPNWNMLKKRHEKLKTAKQYLRVMFRTQIPSKGHAKWVSGLAQWGGTLRTCCHMIPKMRGLP